MDDEQVKYTWEEDDMQPRMSIVTRIDKNWRKYFFYLNRNLKFIKGIIHMK
jgi:hypothetical protein